MPKRKWDVTEVKEYTFVDAVRPDVNFNTYPTISHTASFDRAKERFEVNFVLPNTEFMFIRPALAIGEKGPGQTDRVKYAFMKFDVDNVPVDRKKIVYACVKYLMHKYEVETPVEFSLHSVSSSWSADKLTWNNRPQPGRAWPEAGHTARGCVNIHHDITELIRSNGNGIYAFMLSGEAKGQPEWNGDMIIYSSKRNGDWKINNKPLLYIAYEEQMPVSKVAAVE